ncbi:unnamed protein product, partial [Staurois parvus]
GSAVSCHGENRGFITQDSQLYRLRGSRQFSKCRLVCPFPLWFVKFVLGPVAWRFLSDLEGMKSPILGPCFVSIQHMITQVCAGLFVEA